MDKIPQAIIDQAEVLSSAETKKLLSKANHGDRQAKDKLVKSNLRLVLKIAHRYKNSQYSLEDIFQIGTIGLLKAIDNFDLTKEVEFSTYAVPKIIGEIKMFLRDDHPVKVSRSRKEQAQKIIKLKEKLTKDLNREPTIQELSAEVDLSCEEIVTALEAVQNPTSLYSSTQQTTEKDLELIDQLGATESKYVSSLNRICLQQVLTELDSREEKIFKLRFGADKSQAEVADIIGVSQAHISRLEKKILKFIKQKLE
ncbi:SigB/SigF/SigG family RNA polymerase sigma factor [Halanaerobaculum tunisiense]